MPEPETFAGLMEIYETNYINIRRLCGNLSLLDAWVISQVKTGLDLHLKILERAKYTLTVKLTYQFNHVNSQRIDEYPDLVVRIYYDAKQAEVLTNQTRKTGKNAHLSSKWYDNRFLYKWLNYCLEQGHRFERLEQST